MDQVSIGPTSEHMRELGVRSGRVRRKTSLMRRQQAIRERATRLLEQADAIWREAVQL